MKLSKLSKTFIISAIGLIIVGCGSQNNDRLIEDGSTKEISTHHELALNNGEKWDVDSSMMLTLRKMEIIVNNFSGSELDDYVQHSNETSLLINELTSNCTMTGQAHDELHKWLLPFIDLNDDLVESDNISNSESMVEEQKKEIQIFNLYFK